MTYMPSFILLPVQVLPGTQSGSTSAIASTAVYAPGPTSPHVTSFHDAPSSRADYSQDPHSALADETISVGSASHSGGAGRAVLAGSSFADSDVSADRQPYFGEDMQDGTHEYNQHETTAAGPAGVDGLSSYSRLDTSVPGPASVDDGPSTYRPRVQLSSTPILGGVGTVSVQPHTYAAPVAQHQQGIPADVAQSASRQYTPTAAASRSSQGAYAPAVAPSSVSQGHYKASGTASTSPQRAPLPAATPSDLSQRQPQAQGQRSVAPALSDYPQYQEQPAPAAAASDSTHSLTAPAAAATHSSQVQSGSQQADNNGVIGVSHASSSRPSALERGRAEAANAGLQDERSLRSFFSSGTTGRM